MGPTRPFQLVVGQLMHWWVWPSNRPDYYPTDLIVTSNHNQQYSTALGKKDSTIVMLNVTRTRRSNWLVLQCICLRVVLLGIWKVGYDWPNNNSNSHSSVWWTNRDQGCWFPLLKIVNSIFARHWILYLLLLATLWEIGSEKIYFRKMLI